jgi:hypothetical protein
MASLAHVAVPVDPTTGHPARPNELFKQIQVRGGGAGCVPLVIARILPPPPHPLCHPRLQVLDAGLRAAGTAVVLERLRRLEAMAYGESPATEADAAAARATLILMAPVVVRLSGDW